MPSVPEGLCLHENRWGIKLNQHIFPISEDRRFADQVQADFLPQKTRVLAQKLKLVDEELQESGKTMTEIRKMGKKEEKQAVLLELILQQVLRKCHASKQPLGAKQEQPGGKSPSKSASKVKKSKATGFDSGELEKIMDPSLKSGASAGSGYKSEEVPELSKVLIMSRIWVLENGMSPLQVHTYVYIYIYMHMHIYIY